MPTYTEVHEGQTGGLNSGGFFATRVWIIDGITPGTSMIKVIDDGMDAASLPAYFALHPDSGGSPTQDISNTYMQEISGEWVDGENTIARVTAQYSRPASPEQQTPDDSNPGAAIIRIGSTVSNKKSNKDAAGNVITISLTGQEDQLAEIDVNVPNSLITFSRKESASPLSKDITYRNKVNSVALGSLAAETVLCLGIEGESTDNGLTWNITYNFQYDPDGFNNQIVVYIDPETDRVHNDVNLAVANEGWESVDPYATANFHLLNLPW